MDQVQAGGLDQAVEEVEELHAGDEELQFEEDEDEVDIENASLIVHPGDLGELADVEQLEEIENVLVLLEFQFEDVLVLLEFQFEDVPVLLILRY